MKVTFISNFFPPDFVGGAEIYAYRLCKELVKNGIEVSVITSKKAGEKDVIEYLDGMRIYRSIRPLPNSKIIGKICGYNFNPYAYRIGKLIKETDPDLIHIHNINSTIMLYPLIKYLKKPVILHVHDHWPICYKGTLFNQKKNEFCTGSCLKCAFSFWFRPIGLINLSIRKKLIKKFEEKVNCFITPSNYLRKVLIDWHFTEEKKIKHIPLGIDLNDFSQKNNEVRNHVPTVLFVGRAVSYKNPSLIVRILPKILENIECKYKVIGKGPELDVIKNISKEYNITKYVDIMGEISEKKLQLNMQEADIVVVPSIWNENSPVVIYESLASGTPVIVTNRGGAKELVDDGVTGYIIDPTDEREWVEKIVYLLKNTVVRNKMRDNARMKAVNEFDIKNNAKQICKIYETVYSNSTIIDYSPL